MTIIYRLKTGIWETMFKFIYAFVTLSYLIRITYYILLLSIFVLFYTVKPVLNESRSGSFMGSNLWHLESLYIYLLHLLLQIPGLCCSPLCLIFTCDKIRQERKLMWYYIISTHNLSWTFLNMNISNCHWSVHLAHFIL